MATLAPEATHPTRDVEYLFRKARTQNAWLDTPVSDQHLHDLHELARWGPTSMNCQPMRVLFLRSEAAKERLRPALMDGNVGKAMSAPVVAVIGYDLKFYQLLPRLMPFVPGAADMFAADDQLAADTAFRNGCLQGAYFILAARAAGLDTAPMSGFDNAAVDAEFWPGGSVKSNFLCALGTGDTARLYARSPRLGFDEVSETL
jgi:3-hydroxypropanoate dehydrogenase